MGKFFGSITFFLVAVILVYFLNPQNIEDLVIIYQISDSFEASHVAAVFELLHYPLASYWILPAWLIAGFLGGLVTRSWKGAIFVSIITGFVLSLTWIFFMSRYLPNYWNTFISTHSSFTFFGITMGMGLLLGLISAAPSLLGGYLTSTRIPKGQDQSPIKEIQAVCPNCGTTFQSKPKYCYKCNTLLEKKSGN